MPSPKKSPKKISKSKSNTKLIEKLNKVNEIPIANVIDNVSTVLDNVKEVVAPNPKKESPYVRFFALILVVISFVVILIFGLIGRQDAQNFYDNFGKGCTFTLELWYFLMSILVSAIGLIFIVLSVKKISTLMLLVLIGFLASTICFNLFLYYFVPLIGTESNTRLLVAGIINIVLLVFMLFFVYNNTNYPWFSYLIIAAIIAINAIGLTVAPV